MKKKSLLVFVLVFFTFSLAFAGGSSETGMNEDGTRTAASREDALDGPRVMPEGMTLEDFPGLTEIGAIPKKQYFFALSNGEDSSDWTRGFRDDMFEIAKKYKDSFGIRFEYTSAGFNTTKQLADCQSLIAKKPDVLFLMPNEADAMAVVAEWCTEAGVPLVVMGNQISATAGEGLFISELTNDCYLNGILHGLAIVDALTEKYGEPKGDVAEIQGLIGAGPATLREQGVRRVFADYPDINIVISRPGEWDAKSAYAAAQDIFTVMPDGTLDALIGSFDDAALAVANLANSLGRTDIGNTITGNDGSLAALQALLEGDMLISPGATPYYGSMAFEYAIQYCNGNDIPSTIMIPQRAFMGETMQQKEALKELIAYCESNQVIFAPVSLGYFDVFPSLTDRVKKFYPNFYWEVDPNDKKVFPEIGSVTDSTIR